MQWFLCPSHLVSDGWAQMGGEFQGATSVMPVGSRCSLGMRVCVVCICWYLGWEDFPLVGSSLWSIELTSCISSCKPSNGNSSKMVRPWNQSEAQTPWKQRILQSIGAQRSEKALTSHARFLIHRSFFVLQKLGEQPLRKLARALCGRFQASINASLAKDSELCSKSEKAVPAHGW